MLSEHALRIIAALDQTWELEAFFRSIEAIEDLDSAVAAKKSIVVSTTRGSDDPVDEHDGSESKPWATIAYALTKAVAGDAILVEPGTYTDYLVFTAPVSIFAKVPGTVTITNAGGSAGAAALTFGVGLLSAAYPIVIFGCKIQGYNGNTNITLAVSGLPAGATGSVIRFLFCEFVAGVSGFGVVSILEATATCRLTFDRCTFGVGTLTLARNDTGGTHDRPVEFSGCSGSLSIVAGTANAWALKVTDCAFRAGALTEGGATAGWLRKTATEWATPATWAGAVSEETVLPAQISTLARTPHFGSGADGALNIGAGTTALTKDTYATNVTVAAGGTLELDGCRLFATGTVSVAATGTIIGKTQTPGGNGGNGAAGAGGAAGAAGTCAYSAANPSLAAAVVGKAGGAGGNAAAAGNNGVAGGAAVGMGGSAAAGGNSGTGDGGAIGNGGALAACAAAPTHTIVDRCTRGSAGESAQGGAAGGGGGGAPGGAGGTGGGGGGGGSGAGGAPVEIRARVITNAGTISSPGGAGGNGGNGEASGNTGGGGGGSGGGGGYVYLLCERLTNTGTISAAGGSKGNGGVGNGTGGAGAAGTGGDPGVVVTIELLNATSPVTIS